jgi:hypothetical protein
MIHYLNNHLNKGINILRFIQSWEIGDHPDGGG